MDNHSNEAVHRLGLNRRLKTLVVVFGFLLETGGRVQRSSTFCRHGEVAFRRRGVGSTRIYKYPTLLPLMKRQQVFRSNTNSVRCPPTQEDYQYGMDRAKQLNTMNGKTVKKLSYEQPLQSFHNT